MQPGWYGDPFSKSGLRWWDGNAWTSHTSWQQPTGPTAPTGGGYPPAQFDPAQDLAAETRAASKATWGVLLMAGIAILTYLLGAALLHHMLRDVVHQFRDALNADNTTTNHYTGWNGATLLLQGFNLLNLAAEVLFWIWLYRAATVARRAGLPARREPVWAWLGFVIPIISLWFPYQVASDTLPPGHPARALVNRWWTFWIAQLVASLVIVVITYFSTPAAVVAAVAASALPVLMALNARAMITAITAAHRDLVPQLR
jgi:uncharacterized protein DUF4328/uncharacterized protein DUF2510